MSETTNLKLFKHDNPETNENQFNIETALNENWDKIDEEAEKVNNKLSKLENENLELKSENKRLKEDLKGLPTGTFSGESIDLNDSSEMRLQELNVGGNSRQETREGYNLLNFTKEAFPTQTINGLVITNNEDGSFTLNGTTTDTVSVCLSERMKNLKTGTYNLTRNSSGTVSTLYRSILYGNNSGVATQLRNFDNEEQVITLTEDYEQYYFWLYIVSGITFTNYTIKPMLTKGTEKKDYEEYGVSPSPNYPSEVECCGDNGNISFEMCNKNKLKTEFTEKNKLTKTANREGYYIITDYKVYLEANKIYSFSCKTDLNYGLKNEGGKVICYLMLDKKFDYFVQIITNPKKITVSKTGWYYLRYDIYENNTTASFWDFQLEEGEPTTYEPHKSQTYTIPTQKPFRKIDTYKDTFIIRNGKRYERHCINRLILDNTTNIIKASEGFYIQEPTAMNLSPVYCNNFKNYNKSSELTAQDYGIGFIYNDVKNLYIRNIEFNEASQFKLWLIDQYNSGTPVYIDYVLAEPEDIECTAEQCEILDKIENEAKTYKNITHIYSTDKVGPILEGTYNKDIETMINKIATTTVAEGE